MTFTLHDLTGRSLAAGFALAPLVAIFAPKGMVIVGSLMALSALISLANVPRRHIGGPWLTVSAVAIFLGWTLIASAWSPTPDVVVDRWPGVAAVGVLGLALLIWSQQADRALARRCGIALVGGVVAAILVLMADGWTHGAPRRAIIDDPAYYGLASLNRAATVMAILVWPAALFVTRLRMRPPMVLGFAIIVLFAGTLGQLESDSARAAFGASVIALLFVLMLGRVGCRILGAVFATLTLIAPILPFTVLAPQTVMGMVADLPSTVIHRLYIWRFCAERIAEKPLFGWGFEASRTLPGGKTTVTDLAPSLPSDIFGAMELLPLHPHNGPLQIWLELGMPGALAVAALIWALYAGCARLARQSARITTAAAITAALAPVSFSYGLWQAWWLAALCIAAAGVVLAVRTDPDA